MVRGAPPGGDAVIDHLGIRVSDYECSKQFYIRALAPLGYQLVFEHPVSGAGFGRTNKPTFWIKQGPPSPALHLAFAADDHATVQAFHRAAVEAGGRDNGAPGLRPEYHRNYFGAFVLDPDGHNIEAVCHGIGLADWKPQSHSSVSPYLVVSGAQKVIDFAKAVFGATELRRYDMPDGSIMHAEIRIGDTVVMLGDGGPEFPAFASLIHVYVEEVDRIYERALQAGATPVEAPRTRDGDPDKRGSVKDPCGNTWAIATQRPAQGKP